MKGRGELCDTRTEADSLGSVQVPVTAYWGVHTQRALDNFQISQRPVSSYPDLVVALASVKQAAARANGDLGSISPEVARRIDEACERIMAGEFHGQFVVGVIQGGAGTSTNMNANEVIANVAAEAAGESLGCYETVRPIDHVNRSQSTNDVYPTAVKLALIHALRALLDEIARLQLSLGRKAAEFDHVMKVGRTQLQDAVPMTLGQEFGGFAKTLGRDRERLEELVPHLSEVNLGGTAIGTGITADRQFGARTVEHLRAITGVDVVSAVDLIEATSDVGVFLSLSGTLKRAAIKLSKICNDLRLLSSGPQAGLGEINLPARQAGSSIMPGKVNPVIPEAVNQVAYVVCGADLTVSMAAEAGQLQLNAFEPVVAHSLLQSINWLKRACGTLRVNCIDGITANHDRLAHMVDSSVGVATALLPAIGYKAATRVAQQALETGRPVADIVVEMGLLTRDAVASMLAPEQLSGGAPEPAEFAVNS